MTPNIPITMATQHPDNASVPWWRDDAFVPTHDEIEEVLLLFKNLPIDEYMWDWEGKYVDEAVGEKLFSRGSALFKRHPLGKDLRLTYRIPAYGDGKIHRMARAFMSVLSIADLGRDLGLPRPPVTEMFLPLTTSASQPIKVRKAFKDIAKYHQAVFHTKRGDEDLLKLMDITPLVEDVPSLLSIDNIMRPYWSSVVKESPGVRSRGQRVFLARSDPAMNAGLVPAVLAVKVALSTVHQVGEDLGFPVYPVIGTGSLPFRGSVNPLYVDTFLTQYAGVRTYSIQSAFRYDYPLTQVKAALRKIKREVPLRKVVIVPERDRAKITKLCGVFSAIWKPMIEAIAPLINEVAKHVPARRERLQHIGLFGYSRGVGKVRLPRAIGFTAALYSLGIPPELIATGRGLLEARRLKLLDIVEQYYPALRADLKHAGKYLNRENLAMLAKTKAVWKGVQEDVAAIEEVLGIKLEPEKPPHTVHRNLTSNLYQRIVKGIDGSAALIQRDLVEAGVIRRSLG